MISWESTSGLKNAGVASFSPNKNTMEGQTSCNVAAGGPNRHAVFVELEARCVSGCGEGVLNLEFLGSEGCLALGPLLHALFHHLAFYNVFFLLNDVFPNLNTE